MMERGSHIYNSPIKVNRLHSVYPNEVEEIRRVLMDERTYEFQDAPDGWLEVVTRDGNVYQTELSSTPDPECPVDPELLCRELSELTGIQPIVID